MKKIEAVIVISAGFSETGEKELTTQVQKIINKNNKQTRVLGPNCFGTFVGETGLDTTFSEKQKKCVNTTFFVPLVPENFRVFCRNQNFPSGGEGRSLMEKNWDVP